MRQDLREHRERLGLFQNELAEILGVSADSISLLERGLKKSSELEKRIFSKTDFVCRIEMMRKRYELGMPQREAAQMCGISPSSYYAMEGGYRMLKKSVYDKIMGM